MTQAGCTNHYYCCLLESVCLEFGVCFGVCFGFSFGVSFGVCLLESVSLIERFPKLVGVKVSAGAGVGAGCPQAFTEIC